MRKEERRYIWIIDGESGWRKGKWEVWKERERVEKLKGGRLEWKKGVE